MFYIFNRYLSLTTLFIWLSEFILGFSTALMVVAIRFGFDISGVLRYDPSFKKTIVLTMIHIIAFYYFDLYSPESYSPGRQMGLKLGKATMVAAIALSGIYFLFPELIAGRGILMVSIVAMPLVISAWRTIFSRWLSVDLPSKRVLIIGTGDLAKKIGMEIYGHAEHGLKLVGFIDDDPAKMGQSLINPGIIGGYNDIKGIVYAEKIDKIIVAIQERRSRLPMSALFDCKLNGISIEEGETFQERMIGKIPVDQIKPSWMIFSDGFKSLRSRKLLKRIFDVIFSLFLIILLAPIFLIVALLIKLGSKGPVIYKQTRVGENGSRFEIYKFRSMIEDAEAFTGPVWASTDDNRTTRIGKVIRKLRLDEIPQLFNVIKGEMSFVGIRPERPFFIGELKKAIPYYEIRTLVKPGITGWAQIKYPYGATVEDAFEKFQYDIYYIKNMSILLDMMIIFWTIKVVLTGRGAR